MLYSVFRQMVRLPKRIAKQVVGATPFKLTNTCVTGLALTLSLIVTGCATAPDKASVEPSPSPTPEAVETPKQTAPPTETPDKDQPVEAQPDGQADGTKQPDGEMVTVSVYTIDGQCNDFVEQAVQVPNEGAITEAVGKAMGAVEYNAFKLESYQVNINGSTATVDMQLAPSSQRQFVSLSSCEQRALFGSVEKTLLNNADWNITAVKFTNNGKEILL